MRRIGDCLIQKELTLANGPRLHAVFSNFVIEFILTSQIYIQEAASSPVACDYFLGDIWVNKNVNRKEDLSHSWAVIVPSFSGKLSP